MIRHSTRPGTVIVAVLIVTILAGFFALHVAKQIAMNYGELRDRREFSQCEMLAESGLSRGIARYENDASYPGETWKIPAADLPAGKPATVDIQIKSENGTAANRLEVVATYPLEGPHRHIARRTWQIPFPSSPSPRP